MLMILPRPAFRHAGNNSLYHLKNAERNDGVIIGASSLEHLRHNLTAVTEGPMPTEVLTAIDDAALKAQPKWPPYFYGV
jgi:aflatoxin B1 aldehyde reductase